MSKIEHITRPPKNYECFVEEAAEGFRDLYGPAAAESYRRAALLTAPRTMRHPNVRALAMMNGADAQAMLYSVRREDCGQITFIHVLREHQGLGLETELLRTCVSGLRELGARGITSECVPFCELCLDDIYTDLGFERIERQLMVMSLGTVETLTEPMMSRPCTETDSGAIGALLADAYRGHLERALHVDMADERRAETFVRNAFAGAFGATAPEFVRVIEREGTPAAAVVGCRVATDLGFVLQIAARRDAQGHGLGTRLLRELGNAFVTGGISRMALGVTIANPARALYERLGFVPIRPISAYTWWREGLEP